MYGRSRYFLEVFQVLKTTKITLVTVSLRVWASLSVQRLRLVLAVVDMLTDDAFMTMMWQLDG
jgi:hypothetical protein